MKVKALIVKLPNRSDWDFGDVGKIARAEMNAEYWIDKALDFDSAFYRFVGLKLYTFNVANEVIGCQYGTVKYDYADLIRKW